MDIVALLRGHDPKDYERILREHNIQDYRSILQAVEILKKEKEAEVGKVVRQQDGASPWSSSVDSRSFMFATQALSTETLLVVIEQTSWGSLHVTAEGAITRLKIIRNF